MNLTCHKKNYYLLQTLIEEIPKFDVISFNLFDTLVLRNLLFPQDVYKVLGAEVESLFGIKDFRYLRHNIESELRIHSNYEDITIDEIYNELKIRYPSWPIEKIKKRELDIELDNVIQNPYVKKIFEQAKEKEIWIICDSCFSEELIKRILIKCDINNYSKLFISGVERKAKFTGNLYRYILDETNINPEKWLHIGDNYEIDINIPRGMNIRTAYVRCPRDWFFMNREKKIIEMEEELNTSIPRTELDDSIEFSKKTANKINKNYTEIFTPNEDVLIEAEDIFMVFNMSNEKIDNFKEYIIRLIKHEIDFKKFTALKGVSFKVRKGEKIGLIGVNGSGKSTMLKIVSGVMKPTKGKISIYGSIAPLIELGAGFDFELSARENIFLNGAILGYGKEEMKKYYDYIIDFSELKEFQDVAIKNFSSGMIARLGFSIATCHVPDILIIDEILSVGDFEFQKKCHRKMKELTEKGTTVLFVSHSADDIISICDKAIWLNHGNKIEEGEAQYIVEKYLKG